MDRVDFYSEPALYDLEYRDRTEDVAYYRGLASEVHSVLELGAGTGRLTIPMALAGARVTAVDLARPMLEVLQQRRNNLEDPTQVELVLADFTHIDLGERYDLVVLPFNAIQHAYTPEDWIALMETVHRHLRHGGRFVLDVVVPRHEVWLGKDPEGVYEQRRMPDPDGGELTTWENGSYDRVTQVYEVRYHYERADGRRQVVALPLRMFHPQDLFTLLEQAGWQIARKAGGFDGRPVDGNAETLVLELMAAEDPGLLEY